jgi:hypothetical protein
MGGGLVGWGRAMGGSRILVALLVLILTACDGPRRPLNPAQLVTDSDSDMAVQLFMQATLAIGKYYGFKTIKYAEIRERSRRAGLSTLPFMPPESVRATPKLIGLDINPDHFADTETYRLNVQSTITYYGLVRYYITTGWKASQIICRNYMQGLDERNQYLEFIQREFNVAQGLALGILGAVGANGTLTNAFAIGKVALDNGIDEYQNYRYLNIADREAARVLVSAAQDRYAGYFLDRLDEVKAKSSGTGTVTPYFYTFAEALNAVSTIEYQCTREGIRNLANRTLNNGPTNISVDPNTGALVFKSNAVPIKDAIDAEDKKAQATQNGKNGGQKPKNGAQNGQGNGTKPPTEEPKKP